jgi:hypothetical protein
MERTYADAYTNGGCDADAYRGPVDGGLVVVLLDYDLASRRGAGRRSVERGRWRVVVDVGVVGDVGEPGSAGHLGGGVSAKMRENKGLGM